MTAVLGLKIKNYPLLIGDILLSAPETDSRRLHLPTVSDLSEVFPEGAGFVPTNLSQKVSVISDNIVIGWAGSKIAAIAVFNEIIEKNQHKKFDAESLKNYINNLDKLYLEQGLQLLGFIIDSDKIHQFGLNDGKAETSLFGDVGFIGSGGESAIQCLTGLDSIPESGPVTGNNLAISSLSAVSFTGILLSNEIGAFDSLYEYYGAGYEIVTTFENKFLKVPEVTHVFFSVRIEGREIIISPPHLIIKFTYKGDLLLIRVEAIQQTETSQVHKAKTDLFVITPVYRRVDKSIINEIYMPSLNSNFICSYFSFKAKNGIKKVLTLANSVGNTKPPIRFTDENGRLLKFEMEPNYAKDVEQSIISMYLN